MNNPHIIDVHMRNCNVLVLAMPVDATAARAILPAKYELALSPDGTALIYTPVATCDITDNVTGENLPSLSFADWWLTIKNPANPGEGPVFEHVEGSVFDIPNTYAYVFKADAATQWLKTKTAAIHFYKEKVRSISAPDWTPFSSGKVVEMSGAEYSWKDVLPCNLGVFNGVLPDGGCWMLPGYPLPVALGLPPVPVGFNLRGYQDDIGGGGRKELHCLMNYGAQGIVEFTVTPRTLLATAGLFPTDRPSYGYYDLSYSDCQLIMDEQ